MGKNKTENTTKDKEVEYTIEMLLNDMQDSFEESDNEFNDDSGKRESQSKLIVMQMLLGLAESYSNKSYNTDEKLINAIDVKVNGDEILSGYLFYVSQNPQFDYSWNYMRKCKKSYKEFLTETTRFINNVVEDINMLFEKLQKEKYLHIVFDGIFDVSKSDEKPYVKTHVLWKSFNRIIEVKRVYNISIKSKESILVAGFRKKSDDAIKLVDIALKMINEPGVESK